MSWMIIEENPLSVYTIITTYDDEQVARERFEILTLPAKFKVALKFHEVWRVKLLHNGKRIKSRIKKRDNIA